MLILQISKLPGTSWVFPRHSRVAGGGVEVVLAAVSLPVAFNIDQVTGDWPPPFMRDARGPFYYIAFLCNS